MEHGEEQQQVRHERLVALRRRVLADELAVRGTLVAASRDGIEVNGFDVSKAIPTIVGLGTIPFIVKPIDGTIDTAMEMSVTKALNGKIEGVQDAGVALATISACLVVPPTLFSVAAAIKAIGA